LAREPVELALSWLSNTLINSYYFILSFKF
jgi:hypothetical protein